MEVHQQLTEQHRLIQAIQFLNRVEFPLLAEKSRFSHSVDVATHRVVVKVINKETEEVLYRLPPQYVLELARLARQGQRAAQPSEREGLDWHAPEDAMGRSSTD